MTSMVMSYPRPYFCLGKAIMADGFFKMPNELAEAFAKNMLTGEEWKILWVIIRKTWGWQKSSDKISLSQFAEMTGMKRQNVHSSLKNLSSRRIIDVILGDYRRPIEYSLNANFKEWLLSSPRITLSSPRITAVIPQDYKTVILQDYHKRKKETKQKKAVTKKLTDEEFIATIKKETAYQGIDIDREIGKMRTWLLANPGRQLTRRFMVNWLNKAKPMIVEAQQEQGPSTYAIFLGCYAPDFPEDEAIRLAKIADKMWTERRELPPDLEGIRSAL